MQIDMTPTFTGRVRIEKGTKEKGITDTYEFNNVFLVSGIRDISNRIVNNSSDHNSQSLQLYLGTGTTVPTMYDTGLEARSTTLAGMTYDAGTGGLNHDDERIGQPVGEDKIVIAAWDMRFRYGEGVAAGVWTEVGLGNHTYTVAHTRALIKDEAGNPMELTVLQDEYLVVYYHLEIATQKFHDLGTITVNGTDHRVHYFNRPGSWHYGYRSYSIRSPEIFGWDYSSAGAINQVYRGTQEGTFDPVTGDYSLTISTSSSYSNLLDVLQRELDLDSFGFQWSASEGPFLSDVSVPFLWTQQGDQAVVHFDPPVVIPKDHKIHFNFHTRIKPENYDKTMDPTYDPAFDPELPENQ